MLMIFSCLRTNSFHPFFFFFFFFLLSSFFSFSFFVLFFAVSLPRDILLPCHFVLPFLPPATSKICPGLWPCHQRSTGCPFIKPPGWTLDAEGFDHNCLRQGWRQKHPLRLRSPGEQCMKGHRRQNSRCFHFLFCSGRWGGLHDAVEVHFSLRRLSPGLQTTLTVTITSALTGPRNCSTCSVGQVIRAAPSKIRPWSQWSSAVCFQPLQIDPQHCQLWVGASQGWKIPHGSDRIQTHDLPSNPLFEALATVPWAASLFRRYFTVRTTTTKKHM